MTPSPQPQTGAVDLRLLGRLAAYVRPHARWVLLGLACLLGASLCRLALPFLVKAAIDHHLLPGDPSGMGPIFLGLVAAALGAMFFRRAQVLAVERAGQDALYGLRGALFRHLQGMPARFYDRTPTGRLVGRVTTDIEALHELFSSGVVTILGDFLFLAILLTVLFALDWRLTLVALAVVPLLLATTLFVRTRARSAYLEVRSRLSRMNTTLHEEIAGMSVTQAFGREAWAASVFADINDGLRSAQLRMVRWESVLSAAVEMIGSFTAALVLWYGGRLVLGAPSLGEGGTALTLGTLFAFLDSMQKFFQPLNDLSLKWTVMQNASTAARRIFGLLDREDALPEPSSAPELPPTRGEIVFDRVVFGYGERDRVLREVSFRIAPGEKVALVGATGAGKTTVLKLLTRLYDPQAGRILLDGVDLREYGLRDLRGRVAMVPQDGFLFEGDLLENLMLGKPGIPEEEALSVATRLGLDEIVKRFPLGWREPVRERGGNLSAGEKQLLSFARVMIAAPPVLLLDEATSNVDTRTEELLQHAVHELMRGRTSVAVAHRLSTIRDVDRILVFHRGRLVEEGSHETLLARRGIYWRLVRLQSLHA